jgi:THO complex subunit 4
MIYLIRGRRAIYWKGTRLQCDLARRNPPKETCGDGSPPARLKVENLHYELSEDEVTELFERIGPVVSARIEYDRSGRSEGVAYVTYTSMSHAREAIQKFSGANAKGMISGTRRVDIGQPITVTLHTEAPRPRVENRPRGEGRRGFGRGGPRGRGTRGRSSRPAATQEDLDKELDDFMIGPPPAARGNGLPAEEMALD